MTEDVGGVVLAAGSGSRLRPLTLVLPKALCPIGNVPLVDLALERVHSAVGDVAVNVHHGREAMLRHLGDSVEISVEAEPLGTAGALGQLNPWLDGRHALVVNADAWCPGSLASFVADWDRERVKLLLAGDVALSPTSGVAAALMPSSMLRGLAAEPSGLYETSWRQAQTDGQLEVACHDGPFVDCGSATQYLEANLTASGGANVVGADAHVAGQIDRCVVWAGVEVAAGETLRNAIKATNQMTVLVRSGAGQP
ncbi:MAG: sugar phosphate nucleotidyltransferase [Acidimicrobiales bacterium]